VPSHHEKAKHERHDHDDGEYPPKTKSKPDAWIHMIDSFLFSKPLQIEVHSFCLSSGRVSLGFLDHGPIECTVILSIMEQQSIARLSLRQRLSIISAIF